MHSNQVTHPNFAYSIRLSNGTVFNIDGREVAPESAFQDMFNTTRSDTGGLSIAVPGEIKLLGELYIKCAIFRSFCMFIDNNSLFRFGSGNVSWRRLLEPTINFTRDGWPAGELISYYLKTSNAAEALKDRQIQQILQPDGVNVVQVGETIRMPLLAASLNFIAEYGPQVFYEPKYVYKFVGI